MYWKVMVFIPQSAIFKKYKWMSVHWMHKWQTKHELSKADRIVRSGRPSFLLPIKAFSNRNIFVGQTIFGNNQEDSYLESFNVKKDWQQPPTPHSYDSHASMELFFFTNPGHAQGEQWDFLLLWKQLLFTVSWSSRATCLACLLAFVVDGLYNLKVCRFDGFSFRFAEILKDPLEKYFDKEYRRKRRT